MVGNVLHNMFIFGFDIQARNLRQFPYSFQVRQRVKKRVHRGQKKDCAIIKSRIKTGSRVIVSHLYYPAAKDKTFHQRKLFLEEPPGLTHDSHLQSLCNLVRFFHSFHSHYESGQTVRMGYHMLWDRCACLVDPYAPIL